MVPYRLGARVWVNGVVSAWEGLPFGKAQTMAWVLGSSLRLPWPQWWLGMAKCQYANHSLSLTLTSTLILPSPLLVSTQGMQCIILEASTLVYSGDNMPHLHLNKIQPIQASQVLSSKFQKI